MKALPPAVLAFIDRLRTVPEYAVAEEISLVQAHRRIGQGKADTVLLRGRLFVLLPLAPPAPPALGLTEQEWRAMMDD